MSDQIVVEELFDDTNQRCGAYCKGHVDKQAFCLAYLKEFDEVIRPENVEYILARKVPRMDGRNYMGGWTLTEADRPGRGVFEATLYAF